MRIVAVALVGLASSGCATIIRGSSTDFDVRTDPPGASVKLSTGETCPATPCTFRRARKEGFSVTVSKPGYRDTTTEISHHWSKSGTTTGIVGNAILGGGIGIGVDAATGANQDLFPNPLTVILEPNSPPPAPAAIDPAAPPPAAARSS
jgi:hypothetical protein